MPAAHTPETREQMVGSTWKWAQLQPGSRRLRDSEIAA
jgi:hypothetical protein